MIRFLWKILGAVSKSNIRGLGSEPGTRSGTLPSPSTFIWKADRYKSFFDHVLAPLPPAEKEKVWQHFLFNCEDHEDVPNALHEACIKLDQKKHWILMQVDWKATEEIEWQANAIARTHGLRDTFELPENFESTGRVDEGIRAFDRWLQQRDYKFIPYDTGHDSYYGFVSKEEDVDTLMAFATSDELDLKRDLT